MFEYIVLASALLLAVAAALVMKWRNGRFASVSAPDARPRLDLALLNEAPGERASLVQFSSAFCAPCRTTRVVLKQVAELVPGVVAVEIDAESHLELVREFQIMRTPTVLILDSEGVIVSRASGAPTKEQVLETLAKNLPNLNK